MFPQFILQDDDDDLDDDEVFDDESFEDEQDGESDADEGWEEDDEEEEPWQVVFPRGAPTGPMRGSRAWDRTGAMRGSRAWDRAPARVAPLGRLRLSTEFSDKLRRASP